MSNLQFISFEPSNGGFRAALSMQGLLHMEGDVEATTVHALQIYQDALAALMSLVERRTQLQASHQRVPARLIWQIGDAVFRLNDQLSQIGLQLDNVYAHLTRDLGVNRKWFEKVIIFRRYVNNLELIPDTSSWGEFEKGTKVKAQGLSQKR